MESFIFCAVIHACIFLRMLVYKHIQADAHVYICLYMLYTYLYMLYIHMLHIL